jgi:[protein-PII] uridylyltransferase
MTSQNERLAAVEVLVEGTRSFRSQIDLSIPTEQFLLSLRKYRSQLRENLARARIADVNGMDVVRSYSRAVDEIVELVFEKAAAENGIDPSAAKIAVIGLGGYGRMELAPYSDVDILILCERRTPLVRKVAASFVRLMWDVGFELGHSVQSLVESESILSRNMDTKTALMESRRICGSGLIARAATKQITRVRRKNRELFLRRKIKDAIKRHKQFGHSYQLVEPNVKLSPGGLRDYQTLVWMGMVLHGRRRTGLASLYKMGLLHAGEVRGLEEAYAFLLRTRIALHLITQSKQDHLTVRMQRLITKRLGYGTHGDHLGVELYMKDYYMHTRTVFHITEDIIKELSHGRDVGVLLGRKRRAREKRALSMRVDTVRLKKEPLYVFARQKETGLKLERAFKRRMKDYLAKDLTRASHTDSMRRQFPAFLRDEKNTTLVLRCMHETGFLGKIIPEFNRLTCLKRYDLYHHYTADEHSFRVIGNLEELAASGRSKANPLVRIYSEISDKQSLFLAALLHDIGKIEGRGHARKGAVIAKKILARLGVGRDKIAFISFLVENHLIMSHYSQRRDPTDMGTLQAFCAKVKNRTNLKFLSLLTYADLKATSPKVWTKWKSSLLWGFYLRAHQHMAKSVKKPDEVYKARKRDLLRAFSPGKARTRALRHLDLLPGRYLLTMSASQVRRHLELIDQLNGHKGVAALRKRKLSSEITFCTFDRPFRLSQLCGVLTANDLNILFAFAFTRRDGKVIDVFQVEDLSGEIPIDDKRLEVVQHDLAAVLERKEDIDEMFEKTITRWKRRKNVDMPVPVKVEFDNDISTDFTIIDIFAQDEPGLLYHISRALSEEKLIIHRARISTEANRAIDAFYVQDRSGRKIRGARRIGRIRNKLEDLLAPV